MNRQELKNKILAENFKYDMIKGQLKKNSYISKSKHPLQEVENFKKDMIEKNYLKNNGEVWILNRTIKVGFLMALNLHFGQQIKKNPFKQEIIITPDLAEELEGTMPEKGLHMLDCKLLPMINKDCYKLINVYSFSINKDFLNNHSSDTLGKDEGFILDFLQKQGIISRNWRHGKAEENEADLVDEEENVQYEIIYEFKNSLSKKKQSSHFTSPELFIVQCIDNNYIHTSKPLLKKFTQKTYTSKYKTRLVIFNIGTYQTTKSLLAALNRELSSISIKNHFESIYVITYDCFSSSILFLQIPSGKIETNIPCDNDSIGFVEIKPIIYSDMQNDKKYLLRLKNIFNDEDIFYYDKSDLLKKWINEYRVIC